MKKAVLFIALAFAGAALGETSAHYHKEVIARVDWEAQWQGIYPAHGRWLTEDEHHTLKVPIRKLTQFVSYAGIYERDTLSMVCYDEEVSESCDIEDSCRWFYKHYYWRPSPFFGRVEPKTVHVIPNLWKLPIDENRPSHEGFYLNLEDAEIQRPSKYLQIPSHYDEDIQRVNSDTEISYALIYRKIVEFDGSLLTELPYANHRQGQLYVKIVGEDLTYSQRPEFGGSSIHTLGMGPLVNKGPSFSEVEEKWKRRQCVEEVPPLSLP